MSYFSLLPPNLSDLTLPHSFFYHHYSSPYVDNIPPPPMKPYKVPFSLEYNPFYT